MNIPKVRIKWEVELHGVESQEVYDVHKTYRSRNFSEFTPARAGRGAMRTLGRDRWVWGRLSRSYLVHLESAVHRCPLMFGATRNIPRNPL